MAVATKTERRRETIRRGSRRGATLGERGLTRAALAEIGASAELNPGAADGDEIRRDIERRESMAAQEYRAPDATRGAELISTERDPRYVPLSFLLSDLRRRVKTQTRGFNKEERADIATDAALLIAGWTEQGATAPIYLGARGQLPLRRDWLDADKRTVIRDGQSTRPAPSARAERAMRAAIHQVARSRNGDAAHQARGAVADELPIYLETETGKRTLGAAALQRDQDRGAVVIALPDTDAPELLAGAMGISLTAARALIARGYRLATDEPKEHQTAQLAQLWNVSHQKAKNIMSQGAAEIRRRYPDGAELLDALAAAAPELREQLATRAYRALMDLSAAPRWDQAHQLARAASAVDEWRAASGQLPMERRAVELAAQRIGWRPERISATDYLRRLMRAELRRAGTTASAASRGSALSGQRDGASTAPLSRMRRHWREHEREQLPQTVGAAERPRQLFGDGYGGACSCLYLYRSGQRRPLARS